MRRWRKKFEVALRGIVSAILTQDSFRVHLPAALAAVGLGWALGITSVEWAVLILAMALVVALELTNSALESLARGLTSEHNPEVGRALDMAAGAVLVASGGAAVVGLFLFGGRLWLLWSGGPAS